MRAFYIFYATISLMSITAIINTKQWLNIYVTFRFKFNANSVHRSKFMQVIFLKLKFYTISNI